MRPFFAAFGASRWREERLRAAVRIDARMEACGAEADEAPICENFGHDRHDAAVTHNEDEAHMKCEPALRADLRSRCDALQERFGLTDRERDMAWYLAQGRSKSAISQELHLSENTVKGYTRSMYSKLCIHSKQELIDLLEGD